MLFTNVVCAALLASAAKASPIYKTANNDVKTSSSRSSTSKAPSATSLGFIKQDLLDGLDFLGIQLALGSDNQTVVLKLDSKSTDFWVNSAQNEFCLAYYPVPFSGLPNATEWDSFNNGLKSNVSAAVDEFEENHAESLLGALNASASVNIKSYEAERKSQFQSLLSTERAFLTSEVGGFTKTASQSLPRFLTAAPSYAREFGKAITSKTAAIATYPPDMTEEYSTLLTTVSGTAYTIASDIDYYDYDDDYYSSDYYDDGYYSSDYYDDGYYSSDYYDGDYSIGASDDYYYETGALEDIAAGEATAAFRKRDVLRKRDIANTSTVYDFTPKSVEGKSNYTIDSLLNVLENNCKMFGVFNQSSSKSFVSTNETLFVSSSGEYAFGNIGNDTIDMSGVSFNGSFGVAETSDSNIGILGIGNSNKNSTFKSLPHLLVENGVIEKAVYSLSYGVFQSQILFGAVDYSLISGNLTFFPLVEHDEAIAFNISSVNITDYSVDLDDDDGDYLTSPITTREYTAVLDTTTNNIFLPRDVLSSLALTLNSSFDVSYNESFGRYILNIPEDELDDDKYGYFYYLSFFEKIAFTLSLNDTSYDVSLSNMILPIWDDTYVFMNNTSPLVQSNDTYYLTYGSKQVKPKGFILSALPSDDETITFGLNFISSALAIVVDLEDQQIGLAYATGYSFFEEIYVIKDKIPTHYYEDYSEYDDDDDDDDDDDNNN